MNLTSIGDLAQSLMLRSRSTALKQTISTLTEELSSGQISNVSQRLGGDFAYLSDISRTLTRLEGYSVATAEAALFTETAQLNLGTLQDITTGMGTDQLVSIPTQLPTVRDKTAARALGDLESALTVLNASVAGRSLFGGIETDQAPLASADTLLTGLRTALTGLTDATDIRLAAETWFADPTGFRAAMYSGSDTALAPIDVGPGQQVTMPLMADDPAFRDLLRNMALTALATDAALALDGDTQNDIMRKSGEELMASQQTLVGLRSDIGFAQSRIEEAASRNAAARTSLETAKSTLLSADPYDTATRLEEAQFQLESLYAVTVRSSRLSLLGFLS